MTLAWALSCGLLTTTLLSGCQKPAKPSLAQGSNTTAAEVEISMPPSEEAAAEPVGAPESATEKSLAASDTPPAEPAPTEPAPASKAETASDAPSESPTAEPAQTPAQPEKTTAAEKPVEPIGERPEGQAAAAEVSEKPQTAELPIDKTANAPIQPGDWAQWAGTSYRNNTPAGENIATEWAVGEFDRKTGEWKKENAKNIKWVAQVGSQTYGNPVVAGGRMYVGTNNGAGWLKRYPATEDLGCLLCFSDVDGTFLWQDSSEKLPTGRVHDWPLQGICCAPLVEGNRLWYVTSRGEVKCLDAEGYHDGEDDGPARAGLARIFDLLSNEDPAKDPVAPAAQELDAGKLPAVLREACVARGVTFPEEVSVTTDTPGRKWTVRAKLGEAEREFKLMIAGPRLSIFKQITPLDTEEADVVWSYDMMNPPGGKVPGISQHNMCSCSVTSLGDILFVNTSNGVDESHINIPAPDAPSFMAMDKNTGEVFWTDKSPGVNIHHGQWSSPTVARLGGVDQVLFGGGDGWLYSFKADKGQDGKPELLWKFDTNPKDALLELGGRGTRNDIIGTPVVYDGLVYVAVGQDPEHGEGIGHLWCINPTMRGDLSPQLAMRVEGDQRVPIEYNRIQAVVAEKGEVAVDNPNSGVIWHYSEFDQNGDGAIDFEEEMHRTIGTVVIQDDLLFLADFSGLFHCLDAKTGKVHWTHDMLAASWGSALIADKHVYMGDEDGDVAIFNLDADPRKAMKEVVVDADSGERELVPINAQQDENGNWVVPNMLNSVYSTPIVANNVLYIANKTHVFAIEAPPAE